MTCSSVPNWSPLNCYTAHRYYSYFFTWRLVHVRSLHSMSFGYTMRRTYVVRFVLLISHEGYISSNPILPFFFSPGYNYSHKGYRCYDLVHLKLIVAHPITRHCASPSTSPLANPQPLRSNPPQKVLMPTRYVCSMLAFCSPQFASSLAAIHELQEPTSYT